MEFSVELRLLFSGWRPAVRLLERLQPPSRACEAMHADRLSPSSLLCPTIHPENPECFPNRNSCLRLSLRWRSASERQVGLRQARWHLRSRRLFCPPCSDTVGASLWYSGVVAAELRLAASVTSSPPRRLNVILRNPGCGDTHVKVKGSTRQTCGAA